MRVWELYWVLWAAQGGSRGAHGFCAQGWSVWGGFLSLEERGLTAEGAEVTQRTRKEDQGHAGAGDGTIGPPGYSSSCDSVIVARPGNHFSISVFAVGGAFAPH